MCVELVNGREASQRLVFNGPWARRRMSSRQASSWEPRMSTGARLCENLPQPALELEAKATAPCQCEANDPKWAPPTRNIPKCIFIDLGAADGNSFNAFLSNSYGPVLQFQQHRGFIGNISCDRICNECQHT
mmetsp:Transcript_88671/g.286445  ORF Transcript_88671/g.286445 Transcript_88671/m.286445 type:complete len:132 (+) Transcript_88671:513-908(+)